MENIGKADIVGAKITNIYSILKEGGKVFRRYNFLTTGQTSSDTGVGGI